jgi:glycerol kinase
MTRHLLAIDQGTTGTTALVMDVEGRTLGRATREFPQHFPEPGWVEHEPDEIWDSASPPGRLPPAPDGRDRGHRHHQPARNDAPFGNVPPANPAPRHQIGVPAEAAHRWGGAWPTRETTGLVLDPIFRTKIGWLRPRRGARVRAEKGELAFWHHR